jgi:CheY-like chemotaxis protein
MIEPLALKHGITLTFPRFDEAPFVKADRTRIKQVLINLLSNAIKYNRTGGSVELCCIPYPTGRTRIEVRDTGAGLSATELEQLFQPFNRLGREYGSEEGTGIGLVVSKRLVELMGGAIGAHSTVGAGSVFFIELHAAAAPLFHAAAGRTGPAPAVGGGGAPVRTLLCVEDNPANLLLVEKLLERRADVRLLVARDGVEGVARALEAKPDVILMDINLPGISGLTALGILAERRETAAIPVIALSANAMAGDIEKGLAAGFFRYLTKPIKFQEFMETLDSALAVAPALAAAASRSGP